MHLFPNPAKDLITFQIGVSEENPISLEIYDLQGRLVKNIFQNASFKTGLIQEQVNISDLEGRSYIYKLMQNDQVKTGKLVIQ